MTVRVIEAKEDKVTTADLIEELKKSSKVDYSGAIFTFEGIVRGKEENMNLEKLILTTPDRDKTQAEIEKIVENAKIKYLNYFMNSLLKKKIFRTSAILYEFLELNDSDFKKYKDLLGKYKYDLNVSFSEQL